MKKSKIILGIILFISVLISSCTKEFQILEPKLPGLYNYKTAEAVQNMFSKYDETFISKNDGSGQLLTNVKLGYDNNYKQTLSFTHFENKYNQNVTYYFEQVK